MGDVDKYGFIGGGNMAEAIIRGILKSGLTEAEHVMVHDVDRQRLDYLHREYGIQPAEGNAWLVKRANVVVLAVKPQVMDAALEDIASVMTENHLVISIAAGVTLGHIQAGIPVTAPLIRVMPNTPALALAGAAAICPGSFATEEHIARARRMFDAVGVSVVLDEKLIDVVTGLSGSGPAYVFIFLEALADAGVRLGLPRREAVLLANQTVMGAARLAQETGTHPAALKDMVASPGGTTAAALHALEKGGFRYLVSEAVETAMKRARQLGGK